MRRRAATIAFYCFLGTLPVWANPNPELGKRIYRDGILPSGQPLRGRTERDVLLEGSRASCAACHRKSGYGSTEGGTLVPGITARSLFQPTELRQADLFGRLFEENQPIQSRVRLWHPPVRPAYTDETLTALLRHGEDPAGRQLDPAMPRYDLNNEDLGHLAAYLRSLSSTDSAGVDDSRIHFAIIVGPDLPVQKRAAMLDVMNAYFRFKNADTVRLLQRQGSVTWLKQDFFRCYREWVLHVWEIQGAKETWRDQLERYYREQPVFAALAGGGGEWQPVHEFCETKELPCLFPDTNLPGISGPDSYSVYFRKGLAGEAEALSRYLSEQAGASPRARIVQVFRDNEVGRTLAQALRRGLGEHSRYDLHDRMIATGETPAPVFWKNLIGDQPPAALALWLDDADLSTFEYQPGLRIYLSGSLVENPSSLKAPRDRIYLTHPFSLPESKSPHAHRVRAWLNARGIAGREERTAFNTYFVLALVDYSLTHMAANFSRDYLIEMIEREAETSMNPGVFPRLSLGPGQRFASKGCYIVRLPELPSAPVQPVSDWIVP